MKISSFKELVVWQRAVELATAIYNLTDSFPKEELFGLTSQMRRASVSVPSNIAEGFKRGSRLEFKQFLSIAKGSLAELETQILIAKNISKTKHLNFNAADGLTEEVSKMLHSLSKFLKSKSS